MKTLQTWAKENGIKYNTAYAQFKKGSIPGAQKDPITGRVVIVSSDNKPVILQQDYQNESVFSVSTAEASTRSNKSAFIRPTDRLKHISDIPTAYRYGEGASTGDVSITDSVILCQKAYYGFAVFRATIDLYTEFCVNNIYFKKGTRKARQFFEAYFKKVGLDRIQDMFYRELWRSCNCFIFKHLGELTPEDKKQMIQSFGAEMDLSKPTKIPVKYVILNPADIHAQGSATFDVPVYVKVLSDYELERLRNPRTDTDQQIVNGLPPEIRKQIKDKKSTAVRLPLNRENIIAIFYSKQSYEAFAVPIGASVLEHLNHKRELELMDQAIARTVQQAILLITTGLETKEGKIHINPKNLERLQKIFENESVGRVLISDFSTDAKFIIPEIGDILDPRKYEELNRSIAIGLSNVFLLQGEKFANQNAKIDIFLQKLSGARKLFLDEFLIPEMKEISKALGFKGKIPEPVYEELDLKNDLEYSKIYTRLMELGLLTSDEGFDAIETGKLPSKEDSVENQKEFKKMKDAGLYKPLMAKEEGEGAGRPGGSRAPQSTKKVGPIGGSYSFAKIKENFALAHKLETEVKDNFKQTYKLKRLNKTQDSICNEVVGIIIANEDPTNWNMKIKEYIDNPVDKNPSRIRELNEIAIEHGLDSYSAAILLNSKPVQ
ncbi:MAG: hypothetical protein Q8O88_03465 [bacterium]|nr:hypothetical protein [bacterium]